MKRNWGLASVILAFVILYQYLVLGPQQRRAQEIQLEAQRLAEKNAPKASESLKSATGTADQVPQAAPEVADVVINTPLPETAATMSLGAKRSVQVLSNGALKSATLEDFSPANASGSNIPKVILTKGLTIHSNNARVNKCLQSLRLMEAGASPRFAAVVGNASCELSYRSDAEHRSLLHATMNFKGYENEPGEVYLRFEGDLESSDMQDQNFLSYRANESKENIRGGDLFKASRSVGKLDWLAWGDRYFSTIYIPKGRYNPAVYTEQKNDADTSNPESISVFGVSYPINPEKLTEGFSYEYSLYFGTRDPRVLETISPALVESVDLGFFASIARLMLWALHALNQFFGNYGWSIIALTVIVRALFWPLNRKAYMSSLAMKNLQPEVTRLREKYGKDAKSAQQMNVELMQLYRKNKVNPLGGCLPILLQIPIFIGLYGALNHSIDLYGAPFFGWITNLSAKDPYYVFPALWTASLLAYMQLNPQSMSPQPGMPDMKWMFIGMNIFFGYLSASWPAGLTLYLFVSNLVGILQQILIRRSSKKLEMVQEGA